jgi:hypothetical protein
VCLICKSLICLVDREVIGEALDRVSELFSSAFKVNDMKQEMQKRLGELEKQVHADGLKLVEVEKCKRELRQVREQLLQGNVSPSRCYNCSQICDDLDQLSTDLSYSKALAHQFQDLRIVLDFVSYSIPFLKIQWSY